MNDHLEAAEGIAPVRHVGEEELEQGFAHVLATPRDHGRVCLIVRRPAEDAREIVDEATIDVSSGLIGDNWKVRGSSKTPDGSAHPNKQITLMNARVAELVAGDEQSWAWAGDQLYVDFDLSRENTPPGTRLLIGEVELEVAPEPHTGCDKFVARFGRAATLFVNSPRGRQMNLRGINAKVVKGGVVRKGDGVRVG